MDRFTRHCERIVFVPDVDLLTFPAELDAMLDVFDNCYDILCALGVASHKRDY